ncbi:MAG: haloacid dehalogenase-like hydrolase, partial [Alphaproteobacteria bacterium]|nr:haloacid dehalogenase-like hydrolase [Alphaproteobacteria bacterium]
MKPETIAIFDFDGTLVKGDSLWPFLVAVAGRFRCLASLFEALVLYPFCRSDEARTFIKARLLRRILGGRHVADLGPAIRKLRAWPVWNKTTLMALRDHHAKGHRVVIASGSLDVYLSALLEKVPHDALICT